MEEVASLRNEVSSVLKQISDDTARYSELIGKSVAGQTDGYRKNREELSKTHEHIGNMIETVTRAGMSMRLGAGDMQALGKSALGLASQIGGTTLAIGGFATVVGGTMLAVGRYASKLSEAHLAMQKFRDQAGIKSEFDFKQFERIASTLGINSERSSQIFLSAAQKINDISRGSASELYQILAKHGVDPKTGVSIGDQMIAQITKAKAAGVDTAKIWHDFLISAGKTSSDFQQQLANQFGMEVTLFKRYIEAAKSTERVWRPSTEEIERHDHAMERMTHTLDTWKFKLEDMANRVLYHFDTKFAETFNHAVDKVKEFYEILNKNAPGGKPGEMRPPTDIMKEMREKYPSIFGNVRFRDDAPRPDTSDPLRRYNERFPRVGEPEKPEASMRELSLETSLEGAVARRAAQRAEERRRRLEERRSEMRGDAVPYLGFQERREEQNRLRAAAASSGGGGIGIDPLISSKIASWGIWGGAKAIGATGVAGAAEATVPLSMHMARQQIIGDVKRTGTIPEGSIGDAFGVFSTLMKWAKERQQAAEAAGPPQRSLGFQERRLLHSRARGGAPAVEPLDEMIVEPEKMNYRPAGGPTAPLLQNISAQGQAGTTYLRDIRDTLAWMRNQRETVPGGVRMTGGPRSIGVPDSGGSAPVSFAPGGGGGDLSGGVPGTGGIGTVTGGPRSLGLPGTGWGDRGGGAGGLPPTSVPSVGGSRVPGAGGGLRGGGDSGLTVPPAGAEAPDTGSRVPGARGPDSGKILGLDSAMTEPMAPAGSPVGRGAPGGMTTITTDSGRKIQVAREYAENFRGFLNDYEKAGGVIGPDSGGGGTRGNASYHPRGMAIDVNQIGRNIRSREGRGITLPQETEDALAAKWGLYPGSKYRGRPDAGHFEVRNAAAARRALIERGVPGDGAPGAPRREASLAPTVPGGGDAGMSGGGGGLAAERARFAEELKNPEIAERLRRTTMAENPENPGAFQESILNRAAARGTSLAHELGSRYYPMVSRIGKDPGSLRSSFDEATRDVLAGSNTIRYGTGNASGRVGFGYGRGAGDPYTYMTGNRERYGIENNARDRAWAERMRAADASGAPGEGGGRSRFGVRLGELEAGDAAPRTIGSIGGMRGGGVAHTDRSGIDRALGPSGAGGGIGGGPSSLGTAHLYIETSHKGTEKVSASGDGVFDKDKAEIKKTPDLAESE